MADFPQKTPQHFAHIKYGVPDLTIGPEERALFSLGANKEVAHARVELHDMRTSPDIVKGAAGLDVQGFTYVKHQSALSVSDQWYTGRSVEEVYIPEAEDLVCRLTGAKKAVANNVAFRRKLVEDQQDPDFYYKKGCDLDKMLEKLPRDVALVAGRGTDDSVEPARQAHVDFTLQGLRETVRWCREDIKAAAQAALDAEDAGAAEVPRYAVYSVWRPVKTVKRDPLAVCDWRTVDSEGDLCSIPYRQPSGIRESGETMHYMYGGLPPKEEGRQKWYWLPEQREDEVLIVKFADTASETNPDIAAGCLHASPEVEGTENEEIRNSIECRVLAFW